MSFPHQHEASGYTMRNNMRRMLEEETANRPSNSPGPSFRQRDHNDSELVRARNLIAMHGNMRMVDKQIDDLERAPPSQDEQLWAERVAAYLLEFADQPWALEGHEKGAHDELMFIAGQGKRQVDAATEMHRRARHMIRTEMKKLTRARSRSRSRGRAPARDASRSRSRPHSAGPSNPRPREPGHSAGGSSSSGNRIVDRPDSQESSVASRRSSSKGSVGRVSRPASRPGSRSSSQGSMRPFKPTRRAPRTSSQDSVRSAGRAPIRPRSRTGRSRSNSRH